MYKVMLADDENLILQGLENIIEWEELGLEIVNKASNGQEAIDKFKENPVDIVVTDINMPQVTGLELLKELKKINSDVKFIILSGYDDFSYAKKAIELGVENYILKPIDEEELEKTLKNTINKDSLRRTANNEINQTADNSVQNVSNTVIQLRKPVSGGVTTSVFGDVIDRRATHLGHDWAVVVGTSVCAAADGTVEKA